MTLIAYVRDNMPYKPAVPDGWKAPEPSWRRIIRETADKHGVSAGAVASRPLRRGWPDAPPETIARHEAAWRMRNELNMSLPAIAKRLGYRNHTSIMHACKAHEARAQA